MQAPVGPAGTRELVAAVSGSGALGTLAASWTPVPALLEQLRWLQSHCEGPFCVNLVLAFEQRQRLCAALDEGAGVVSFSWGVDPELVGLARDSGAYVLVQVGTSAEAPAAVEAGAHALIVQGVEAGGHVQSTRPLLELVREISPLVDLPVVAAGGVGDRVGVEDALRAGAAAVACGTVFLAAEEADVHPSYLRSLIESRAEDTTLTRVFDGGWPDASHRVIRNAVVDEWEAAGMPGRGRRPGEGETIAWRNQQPVLRYDYAQPTRDADGNVLLMAMYAGTSVSAVKEPEPAGRIVERMSSAL